MKVIRFYAENIKKLKCVEIIPKANVIPIAGKNANGKTSVLDSIYYALAGKDSLPSHPVRRGASKAIIKLDLGEVTVVRRFTAEGGTSLTIEAADKSKFPSPQKMLDDLVGNLAFDPLDFARMGINTEGRRKQLETLRRLVPIEVDIDALDAANAVDYAKRTEVNRQADSLKARILSTAFPEDLPAAEIDIAGISQEMEAAAKANNEIIERQGRREREKVRAENLRMTAETLRNGAEDAKKREVERYRGLISLEDKEFSRCADRKFKIIEQIGLLERQIETLKSQIVDITSEGESHQAKAVEYARIIDAKEIPDPQEALESIQMAEQREKEAANCEKRLAEAPPLPEPRDLSGFRQRIQVATSTNQLVRQRQERDKLAVEFAAKKRESDALTKAMEKRTEQRQQAIASAKMPIPGLSFGEGEVLFNGLPLDQASDAERLRISVAIAMACNPKLRVLRIRDGSLLDESNLALISQMAQDQDYQIWLEVLKSDSPARVEMSDGEAKQLSLT